MKKILVVLISLLILAFSSVFAEEGKESAERSKAVKEEQKKSRETVPKPAPEAPKSGSDRRTERAEEEIKGPPQEAPSGSVTPDQIRKFFSQPKKEKYIPKHKEENYIILNFDNADLKDVINTIGSITNENFILSPGTDARITIHSAKKIPVSEVLNVFESVLEVNGLSLVKSGDYYKIVTGTTAKQKPLDVRKGSDEESIPDVDRPVTQIVPVQYVPVTELSTVLTPMLSQFGSITPNPRNNLLIINDLSSSIIRLLKVLKELDVDAFQNTRMTFFKPRYSDVLSLSNELTDVLNALNLTREGIALVPIERINSLVVFSSSPALLKTVEGWLKKLDEEVMTGQNIFVYPVQNVKAETIVEILKTLYEATDGSIPKTITPKKVPASQRSGTKRTTSVRRPQQNAGMSRVEIMAFEPANSLVILAPPGIYRDIVKTIKKLDLYPREVLIEAVVAEVSLSESEKLGVQWSVLHNINIENRDVTGLVQNKSGELPPLISTLPILGQGSDGGLTYFLFRPEKFAALIQALASNSNTNILSSPRLLVKDQEEASIEVGEDIPTATSTTQSTTADTLTQNIEYRTVGIKLKIKPTISEEKTVVLDVEQEVSALGEQQQVGQEGTTFPSFRTTKTKTSIVVPHKQGIIIGGIIDESMRKSHQGIPLLKDIPILGHLFRFSVDEIDRKELIILITPHVVADRIEADVLTREFMAKLKDLKQFLQEKESQLVLPVDEESNANKDYAP